MATFKPLPPQAQDEAENSVIAYSERSQASRDLLIRFNELRLSNSRIQCLLREQRVRRVSYDRITGRLKLFSMAPNPLYQAIINFVFRFILRAQRTGFFTGHEADRISSDNDPLTLRTTTDMPVGKKLLAFSKYADANIVYGLPHERQVPMVVFEVGLSESREDLRIDAWQWLMCSGEYVRLVVIVDVEDRRALLARRKSDEGHYRRRSLLESFRNEKARLDNYLFNDDNDEIITQVSQDDETVYAEVAASILLDDWVGPVTATLEVWEKGGDGQPRLRDGPTVSYSLVLFCIHTDILYLMVDRSARRHPYKPGHQNHGHSSAGAAGVVERCESEVRGGQGMEIFETEIQRQLGHGFAGCDCLLSHPVACHPHCYAYYCCILQFYQILKTIVVKYASHCEIKTHH